MNVYGYQGMVADWHLQTKKKPYGHIYLKQKNTATAIYGYQGTRYGDSHWIGATDVELIQLHQPEVHPTPSGCVGVHL